MGFPWILQRYVFRELRNNFILTAIALTGILSFGGGVLNMLKLGEVTPGQFGRMMMLFVPVAAALTLPIAALFSAAVSYGRLSADNEFVACRASGINLLLLLLPTVAISLVSAAITFGFVSFMIPRLVKNLNELIGRDIGVMIEQRLRQNRTLSLAGRYRIHADEHEWVERGDTHYLTLRGVTFVEGESGNWSRYGTAREVVLHIRRDDLRVGVSGVMRGLSFYDRRQGQFIHSQEQPIVQTDLNAGIPPKIKFLTLGELLHFRSRPYEWIDVRKAMDRLRSDLTDWAVYESILKEWSEVGSVTLLREDGRTVLRAEEAKTLPKLAGIEFARVAVDDARGGTGRSRTAGRAVLRVVPHPDGVSRRIEIELLDVQGSGEAASGRTTIGPFAAPGVGPDPGRFGGDELLAEAAKSANESVSQRRTEAVQWRDKSRRQIAAALNERFTFSVSVFVLVVLAAALGIALRGSHVLTAFGISFVPMILILITILAGRQMSQNAPTHVPGLLVMWSGIVLIGVLDVWVVLKVLRR